MEMFRTWQTPNIQASAGCSTDGSSTSIFIIVRTNETIISKDVIPSIVLSYLDVFSHDILDGLYLSSSVKSTLDTSAVKYPAIFSTIGKQKLAQYASGASPWKWQNEHHPFNPTKSDWLTYSASSGGDFPIAVCD
ncbi:amidase family protein [Stemphylium lycopersici]|nr:amidase family protein [Stemphylium lycopersici]